MCGDRQNTSVRIAFLALAGCALAVAQPNITSLQSALLPAGSPQNITQVTSGIWNNQANGFLLVINGSFLPAAPTFVNWNNLSGGPSGVLQVQSVSGTQIVAVVAPNLYNAPVASPQTARIV